MTKELRSVKISYNSRLKTYEVLMLFGAMILSINLMTKKGEGLSFEYKASMIFACFGAADAVRAIRITKADKYEFFRYIGLSVIFFIGAVLVFFSEELTTFKLMYYIYCPSIIFSRIVLIVKKHRPISIIYNLILILAAVYLIFVPIFAPSDIAVQGVIIIMICMTAQSFIRLFSISMSQIRFDILKRIFIKSMATEVFLGLLILVIASSLLLTTFEPTMDKFSDALWYCFAIVTTIGFGDFAATSSIGRIVSVILGIYVIIVVALITSIIINFYNETKDARFTAKGDKPAEDTPPAEPEKQEKAEEKPSEETAAKQPPQAED